MKRKHLNQQKELEDYFVKNKMIKKITLKTVVDIVEKLADRMDRGFKSADKSIDIKLEKLAVSTGKGFEDLEKRMNERFDKVDSTLEHKTAELSTRLTSVESRTRVLEAK